MEWGRLTFETGEVVSRGTQLRDGAGARVFLLRVGADEKRRKIVPTDCSGTFERAADDAAD